MMAIDILEKGEIRNRYEEQPLLLRIRGGSFKKEGGTFREEFYELLSDYEKKMDSVTKNTTLTHKSNMKRGQVYVMPVNEKVMCGKI